MSVSNPHICPICGERKTHRAKMCKNCRAQRSTKPDNYICPNCKGPKSDPRAKVCWSCHTSQKPDPTPYICPQCGERKSRNAITCLACRHPSRNKAEGSFTCPACGKAKKNKSAKTCWDCYRNRGANPDDHVCPICKGKKDRRSMTCRACMTPHNANPEGYKCPICGGRKSRIEGHTCMACRSLRTPESHRVGWDGDEVDFSGIDPVWAASFAAFFHGEGCVTLKRTNKDSIAIQLAIKLRADDKEALIDVHKRLGGRFTQRDGRDGQSPQVEWTVGTIHRVQGILKLIDANTPIPYKKLQDVQIGLNFCEWRLNQPLHRVDWSAAEPMLKAMREVKKFKPDK